MANIVTGFFRLYCRGDWHQAHVSRKRLLKTLFTSWNGHSYYVPAWSRRISPQIIELQGGFKWSIGSGVSYLQERFGERLEAIWAREFDEGSDTDWILYDPCSNKGSQDFGEPYGGKCRYGCDRVELHWRPEAPLSLQDQRVFPCNASYLGLNNRCFLRGELPPYIRTPTTPALPSAVHGFSFSGSIHEDWGPIFPSSLMNLRSAINQYATHVDYFWRGRLVQRHLPWRDVWLTYYADGWDNCLDEAWLHWQDKHQASRP